MVLWRRVQQKVKRVVRVFKLAQLGLSPRPITPAKPALREPTRPLPCRVLPVTTPKQPSVVATTAVVKARLTDRLATVVARLGRQPLFSRNTQRLAPERVTRKCQPACVGGITPLRYQRPTAAKLRRTRPPP